MVGKTYWLAGSALALLVAAGPAMAADLPTPGPVYKAPPPMVAPVNWTGFYIGAGSGFAVFDARTSVQGAGGANQGGKGWLVSGFTGYDYQIGNIVAGVLGDFDWGNVTGGYLDPATGGTGTMKEKYQWAVGGRLGWLVFPEFLAYVSGGYTQAHFNGFGLTNGTTLPSNTYNGWFASIGVDTTFPLLGNGWFFRSDYRFAQYNTATLAEVNGAGAVVDLQTIRPSIQTVTAGLAYKFNSAPTTALGAGFSFADFLRAPRGPSHWTGFYLAGGGGYGTWAAYSTALSSPGGVPLASTTNSGRGWFGTVNGGYDYQVTDRLVAGAFADFDFAGIKGTFQDPNPAGGGPLAGSMSERSSWAAGLRGGWLITPAILSYYDIAFSQANFSSANLNGVSTVGSHTYNGWFLGTGLETALPFFGNGWFARIEYRYATYKNSNINNVLASGAILDVMNVNPVVQTIRTELVYRF
jgi:outer membrane immunogenic protein